MDDTKIQQYLILAKAVKGRSLADLISKATAEPGLFAFGELLALCNVQDLKAGEHASYYALLELFCYGTWEDSKMHQASLPPLSPQQQHKLRQLTTVSLAARQKVLPYDDLQRAMDLPGLRQLEDFLITDCFYPGILQGKLDQRQRCLQVHSCISRDVRPEQLPELSDGLANWLQAAEGLLASLEQQMVAASNKAEVAAARKLRAEAKQEEMRKNIKAELELRQADALGDDALAAELMDEDGAGGSMMGAMMGLLGGAAGRGGGAARPKRRR